MAALARRRRGTEEFPPQRPYLWPSMTPGVRAIGGFRNWTGRGAEWMGLTVGTGGDRKSESLGCPDLSVQDPQQLDKDVPAPNRHKTSTLCACVTFKICS